MSYPILPTVLQKSPLREGYERGPARAANQTQVESGPDIRRRATRIQARAESINWRLSGTEFEEWERFYDEDLGGGVSMFHMPSVNADGSLTSRLVAIDHQQGQKPYTAVALGIDWRVSFKITVYY